jgi:hypothetical protein
VRLVDSPAGTGVYWILVTGQVAQSVEQWTENPCVGGSIPSLTTQNAVSTSEAAFCRLCTRHVPAELVRRPGRYYENVCSITG